MKKTIKSMLLFAVAAMALNSCAKQEILEPAAQEKRGYVYVFNLASDDTKALIGDDSIEYESADGLGVFVGDIVNSPSGIDVSADPVTVTVTASKPIAAGSKLYAYYPYSAENASAAVSEVSLSIPAEQKQSGAKYDADAMPMVSLPYEMTGGLEVQKTNPNRDPVGELYMNNLGAVVEFNIFGSAYAGEKITAVRFVSETKIVGEFDFDLASVASEDDLKVPELGLSSARTSLTSSLPVGESKASAAKVYMVVAPGSHKGVVEVQTETAMYVFNMDAAVTFNRSRVRPLNLDLAKGQRNVFDVLALMKNAGYDPESYMQLEMNYTNYAYWHTGNSSYGSKLCTTASNCSRFVASQIFTKEQIPTGSVVVCAGGNYQYRPEGWTDLDVINGTGSGQSGFARPDNVTASVVEVDDAWWASWNYRAFNLSYAVNTNLTDETALAMQQNFAVFVPRIDHSTASLEEILDAAGYDLRNYTKLDIEYTDFAYYNSTNKSEMYTLQTSGWGSTIDDFIATPLYTRADLPVGTLLVVKNGYMYRPEGWVDLATKNNKEGGADPSRPANVMTNIVEVDDAWWGNWKYRGFNLAFEDRTPLASSADATETLCPQVRESFGIFVPQKAPSAQLTELIRSAGYNPKDYVQIKIDYTDFAYYQSNTDYLSTLRTVGIDGWNGTISDFVATPIYTRADLPNGTLLVQVVDHHYRPEGWADLNVKAGSRPADVTESVVKIDEAWWGSYNYRGFNLSLYESGNRQDLADSQDAATNRCQEVRDGFGIFVPKKAVVEKTEDGGEAGKSIKILAIGNSFSMDAMEYLYGILEDVGYTDITLGNIYKGGCTLETHADYFTNNTAGYTYYQNTTGSWTSTSSSAPIAPLQSQDWDYITMQQGSPVSGQADTFDPYLATLVGVVKSNCPDAQLVWHMTWAYQANSSHSGFANYGNDQMTMYNAIVSAVRSKILTNSNFVNVIPNGTAVQNMRTSYVGDTITRDGYHMSYDIGRYLTALTFAKALTGCDLADVTYTPSSQTYTAEDIAAMKDAADKAIATPYAVTQSAYPPDENAFDYTAATLEEILVNDGYDPASYNKLELSFTNYAYWNSTSEKLGGVYSEKYSAANESTHGYTNYKEFICTQIIPKSSIPAGSVIVVKGGCKYRPDGWVSLDAKAPSRPAEVTSNYTVLVNDAWWGTLNYRGFNVAFNPRVVLNDTTCGQLQQSFAIYVPKK